MLFKVMLYLVIWKYFVPIQVAIQLGLNSFFDIQTRLNKREKKTYRCLLQTVWEGSLIDVAVHISRTLINLDRAINPEIKGPLVSTVECGNGWKSPFKTLQSFKGLCIWKRAILSVLNSHGIVETLHILRMKGNIRTTWRQEDYIYIYMHYIRCGSWFASIYLGWYSAHSV